jgi:hypothetical protein
MAFNELKNQSEMVQEETRAYVESTFAYYKLWGFKIAMKSTTMAIKAVLIVLCIIMVFLFGSVAAALAIGQALASNALGFFDRWWNLFAYPADTHPAERQNRGRPHSQEIFRNLF